MLTLHANDARKPLRFLHLKSRTIQCLHQAGIRRIDHLIAWPKTALQRRFPSLQQGGGRDIERAFRALSRSISSSGKIDWIRYAHHSGFQIMPKRSRTWAPIDVIRVLPQTALQATRARYGDNAAEILKRRLIGPASGRPTLQKAANQLGITKEGSRFHQNRVLEMLRQVVLNYDYTSCPFYIRPEYLMHLHGMGRYLIRKIGEGLTYSEWTMLLRRQWRVDEQHIATVETLMLELFGFNLLTFPEGTLRPIICRERRRKTLLLKAAEHALKLLTDTHHQGLGLRELQEKIGKRFKARNLSDREIRIVLESLAHVKKEGGLYLAETSALRRITDRCERVLESSGKPLYYQEIIARATGGQSRRNACKKRTRLLLSADPRFVPTSEPGFWALRKWKVETRTIAQICLDELKKAGRPLDEDYLYRATAKRRSVKLRSISRLLSLSRDVQRVGPKLWALANQPST